MPDGQTVNPEPVHHPPSFPPAAGGNAAGGLASWLSRASGTSGSHLPCRRPASHSSPSSENSHCHRHPQAMLSPPSPSATCSCRTQHPACGLPAPGPRALPHSLESVSAAIMLPFLHFSGGESVPPAPPAPGAVPSASWGSCSINNVLLASSPSSYLPRPPPVPVLVGLRPCQLRLFNTHWDRFLPPSPLSLSFAEAQIISCPKVSESPDVFPAPVSRGP